MKRIAAALAVATLVAVAGGPASASIARVDDFVGVFTDADGNKGYAEVGDNGSVRACNENGGTPAGDSATGYIWVNANGEPTTPTYGNSNVGAGDSDGEGAGQHDCP